MVMKKVIIPAVAILLAVACAKASSHDGKVIPNQKDFENLNKNELAQFSVAATPAADNTFDFENYAVNQLPSGWSQYYSGAGGTDWKITNDQGNKVLAQLYSDNPNGHFNIVVNNEITAKNMTLSVKLKGVTGKHDQGGGLIWRFTDKNNYYVVRANPLENNVVLYKVENGKRTDLPLVGKGRTYGVDVDKLGNGWNTLSVTVKDDLFTVFLNGKELFKVKDNTFPGTGKIGLWTKADAVTYFDEFKIKGE